MSPSLRKPWLVLLALGMFMPSSALAGENDADSVDDAPAASSGMAPLDSAARDKLERDLSGLLADPALGFCKDADIARAQLSSAACALSLAHARQRCPALEKACSSKPAEPSEAPPAERPAPAKQNDTPLVLPGVLGTLLFWGLLALLLVLIIRLLLPLFEGMQAPPEPVRQKAPDDASPNDPVARHQAQESDVDRLLSRADAERKQGRFEEAIATLYAALVHKLGQDQLITVEAARTNGDYLHELAQRPKLQGAVRQVFRVVERVQFGRSQPSNAECEDLLGRILPIVKRGATLVLLGLVLATGVSACSAHARSGAELSPDGTHLLTELLKQSGTAVRRRVRTGAKFDPDVGKVLVLGDDVTSEVWAGVLHWANDGGSVVVAQPRGEHYAQFGVSFENTTPCSHPLTLGAPLDKEKLEVIGVGRQRLRLDHELVQNANIDASCDGQAYVVSVRYGEGSVTLLEGPELLSNASLTVGDNAAFAVSLLRAPGSTLELVDEWTGGGESSPVRALQNAGMRPLLLEILVFMAVLIWRYGAAFGTRRDPNAPTRRAFVDHVWALGRSYARARANRHALGQYSAFALEQLRERHGRGAPLGLIDLAGELSRRTGRREQELMPLLTEAHEAAQERASGRGNATDLDTLRKLESLLYPTGGSP